MGILRQVAALAHVSISSCTGSPFQTPRRLEGPSSGASLFHPSLLPGHGFVWDATLQSGSGPLFSGRMVMTLSSLHSGFVESFSCPSFCFLSLPLHACQP